MRKLIPALPTIAIASILAIDFADLLSTLYLGVLVIYPIVVVCEVVVLLFLLIKTRTARHSCVVATLILLIGTILLPLLYKPVASALKSTTSLNAIRATVRRVYRKDDVFKFVIVGRGNGSKENLSLDSGFANILINSNRYSGPSLYYILRPAISIKNHNTSEPMNTLPFDPISTESLSNAFMRNQMAQISAPEYTSSFRDVLEALAGIDSKEAFDAEFKGESGCELELIPRTNAVYRVIFLLISAVSVVTSLVLCKSDRAHLRCRTKSLEATS